MTVRPNVTATEQVVVRLGLAVEDVPPEVVPKRWFHNRQRSYLPAFGEDRQPTPVMVEVLQLYFAKRVFP